MPVKKIVFLITALFYTLFLLFPLFSDTFQIPVWLPSLFTFTVLLILYPSAFVNKTFFWFLLYALVLGIYVLVGKPLTVGIGTIADSKKLLIEFAYILPTISILGILSYLKDYEITKRLFNWSLLILYVSFLVSVPLMLRYNSLREALLEQEETFTVPGLPGYSLMHAYTLFLPTLGYAFRIFHGRKKWLAIIGLLGLCFVVYDTFVTTSLIIMIAIMLFTITYTPKSSNAYWIIAVILALILYILYQFGFFIKLIDWIMPAFEGTAVESKLLDFKASMLQGELTGGSITVRQNLHGLSWNSFLQNPFFGTGVVGGHSSILDRLGGMGLVAAIPFVMIFVSFIKKMVKMYDTQMAKAFFWVGIIAGVTFLYQKGNWGREAWLIYMVLMPMGILKFENKQTNGSIS